MSLDIITNKNWQLGVLLIPGYNLAEMSHIVEPLEVANHRLGHDLYQWTLFSLEGGSLSSSCGIQVNTLSLSSIAELEQLDALVICASHDIYQLPDQRFTAPLKRLASNGVLLGGVGSGAFYLYRVGLLDDCRWTIDHRHLDELRQQGATPNRAIFNVNNNRFTCQGGSTSLDMMLHIIHLHHGKALAISVAEEMNCAILRTPKEHRLDNKISPYGWPNSLQQVASLMENNIDEPLSLSEISEYAGLGKRQIQRLFKVYIGISPSIYYLEKRLNYAHKLLFESEFTVEKIAIRSGFSSLPSFYKCYKKRFGLPPLKARHQKALMWSA
ncbi:MAG: helix-turn-helix domain-containing protein [Gammaproteobacteria bacterium]|nr:helix-turn-helix domain-containing protein [Gammaproteobacteria bacterium]